MGGSGSGNRNQCGKRTTAQCLSLDIRELQRKKLLMQGNTILWSTTTNNREWSFIRIAVEADRVILKYQVQLAGGGWERMEYPVYLEWTQPNLGGKRPWFRCPAPGCGRRVAILYVSKIFACRHCQNLAYRSQRESGHERLTRRTEKYRARLKWPLGVLNRNGHKPKGMHWKTYYRLKAIHDAHAERLLGQLMQMLEAFRR